MIATEPQMTVEEVREVFSIPAHWPVEWNARTGCWQTTKPAKLDNGEGDPFLPPDVDARALELAKAHHAAMGPAMRKHFNLPFLVGPWEGMPPVRREALVAVMRDLLDKGVIA